MNEYTPSAPKTPAEHPPETRSRRDTRGQQPGPTPELGRKPQFVFTDFASI